MKKYIRTYKELIKFQTFEERLKYLQLNGIVGEYTFGFDRAINQMFYHSEEWKRVRRDIIIRDNGCDLGLEGYDISGGIIVHHMNPLELSDITESTEYLFNPNYLISMSPQTHRIAHYGGDIILYMNSKRPLERVPGDTYPWR